MSPPEPAADDGPPFDAGVSGQGYLWHYLDAVSHDGRYAIVIIAMVGNPFSPRYARARARGHADPLEHCAMNVALYGDDLRRVWTLDEHRVLPQQRSRDAIEIARSSMRREHGRIVVELDARTTPISPRRRRSLRGRVTLHVESAPRLRLAIDEDAHHHWWPIAPLAHVEVELDEPSLQFRGHGYHDANAGDIALEASFSTWGWSRARLRDRACLTYDVTQIDGRQRAHAFTVASTGAIEPLEHTELVTMPRGFWGVERTARVDAGAELSLLRSLEDGPFYTRELVRTALAGEPVIAMHESLAAHRLRRAWVRWCVAQRMRVAPR
ncbi:MAG: carotenoid 1,2-hydratase [Deltaproteobacteria bacterium]|nr:carotenoid 1,2-hydratase [Nannocystaceae bacterium]